MTPDELAAIRARHVGRGGALQGGRFCDFDATDWPCDAAVLLAALDAEQQRRERVEAALTVHVTPTGHGFGPNDDPYSAFLQGVAIAREKVRAALVTDASEGEA